MTSFPDEKTQFIYEEVFAHFIQLAKNTNGLCVIKKLVQIITKMDLKRKMLSKIQENEMDLVQDPYGNYAVTEVINVRMNTGNNGWCLELGP